MTVLRDDKDELVVEISGARIELTTAPRGHRRIAGLEVTHDGWGPAYPDREDWIALRDWINAALTSGAIR